MNAEALGSGCPPDLALEALLLAEPDADGTGAHLLGCAPCRERLAWMTRAGETFRARVYPRTRRRVVERLAREEATRPAGGWRLLWSLAPAAAALALIAIWPQQLEPEPGYVGVKGQGTALAIYLGEGSRGRRLVEGDRVRPGDGLRFVLESPAEALLLVSVDATGRVSRIHPPLGEEGSFAAGVLPGGVVLDETPGPERFFAIFGAPGDPTYSSVEAAVRQALKGGGEGALRRLQRLPLRARQESLLLEKARP
jgi:hypothetical protein